MSKSTTGAPKRVAVGLLAGALSVFGMAFAPPAGATADATLQRIAGVTRYGTAGAGTDTLEGVATESYPTGNDCIIVATGEVFADSLAGSGLAGVTGCPILLVQQDAVPQETSDAIDELGATSATILGGIAAVSQGVEDELNDMGITTDRIFGPTRYETAAEIAAVIDADGASVLAIVASGEVAADAQSSGPIAAAEGAPILLATQDDVPAATSDALAGRTEVLIAGGTARISDDTEADIEAASDDADAERLAGLDRQETAALIAGYEVGTLGWDPDTVSLAAPNAPNDDFSPDALVVGPLGGLRLAPTLIVDGVDTLGPDAEGFISDHSDTIAEVLCIGGTAVLSDGLCDEALALAQAGVASAGTDAPELISCGFSNLTTTGGTSGVGQLVLSFEFDEAILATPIVQTGFKLYTPYGSPAVPEIQNSNAAQIDSADATKVQVVFDVFGAGSYGAIEGTVCTVVANSVQDSDGKVNPEGEFAPSFAAHTYAQGITRNPDLTAVAVQTADTVYDFTFDSGVVISTPTDFRMVDTSGAVRNSTAASVLANQTPANSVVRVTFAAPTAPATGVRGVVLEAAITTSLGSTNAQQAVDVGSSSGLSDTPDLVSITVDDANDRITFTFDETIDTLSAGLGNRQGFHVYYRQSGGAARDQTSTNSTELSSSDPRSVIAQFPAGGVNEFVAGGWVAAGAVSRAGSVGATPNRVDEEGVGSTFAAGAYLGPELVSATSSDVSANPIPGSPVTGRKVVYVFDEVVTLTSPLLFFVTDSDGNRTNLTGCTLGTAGTTPDNKTVTCAVVGTTSTLFTEIGDSELATVASGAVTGVESRTMATGAVLIANHEEAAAAPGTARDVVAP